MEIVSTEERAAVIYRRDPVTKQTMHAIHDSAQAALARYDARPEPMELVWMDMPDHIGLLWDLLDAAPNN